jgi:hypothetical protein
MSYEFSTANADWNCFHGTYFIDGIEVKGDVIIQPAYKLTIGTNSLTSTLVGYLSTISISRAIHMRTTT